MKNKQIETMKAVYCYFFPEVREVLDKIELPDELFKVTASAEEMQKRLKDEFDIDLDIPQVNSKVDLDRIHEPIIARIIKAYNKTVPALKDFENIYPTSGSSEGLFHILTNLKVKGINEIYVLDGEYEGYAAQCTNLKINTIIVKPEDAIKKKPGIWFISNPSARDGNIISNEFINGLCDAGHKVILDLAYVGSTKEFVFDIAHKNIIAVVMSFSKPYGVFRFRIGGFTFIRKPIDSLYGNKWFKDVPGLFQALKLAEEIGPHMLHKRYKAIQDSIIEDLNDEHNLNLRPSDTFLLAYLSKKEASLLTQHQKKLIEPFRRGDNYRFCLTPYFEKLERGHIHV